MALLINTLQIGKTDLYKKFTRNEIKCFQESNFRVSVSAGTVLNITLFHFYYCWLILLLKFSLFSLENKK